jgi:hypothetical protein
LDRNDGNYSTRNNLELYHAALKSEFTTTLQNFSGAFFLFDSEDGTIQTWAGAPSASMGVDNGPIA